ncbi:10531_t:CDS:2, partial [Funneliformis geosporum]
VQKLYKIQYNPSDDNSEQSVDEPSKSSEYITKIDNILDNFDLDYDILDKIQYNEDNN